MSTLDYFLKANLYGLLFAGCYHVFLRRHTFLNLNRAYLLLSAVLSLALPLASLPAKTVETFAVPVGVITLPVSIIATAPVEPTGPDWTLLGTWAYGLVAFGLLLRLAIQLGSLLRLIRQSDRQKRDGYVLVLPRTQTTPTFSFFRYVVLNPADVGNELILNHELVHVRQHHSADVFGLAILRAVFWPVLVLTFVEGALRHVHEFLADRAASDNKVSAETNYAQFLVEYTFGVRPNMLTNGFFNPLLLKQRILMLHQRATNRWALSKYALVLPLTFSLLAMTTAREKITAVVTQATDETITVSGKVTGADGKPISGATVIVKGTTTGTSTTAEGRYTFNNVPKDASLVVSFIGFASQTVQVKGRKAIDIVIARAAVLNEVVVTAYQSLPRLTPPSSATTLPNQTGGVYNVVEQVPEFPGGMSELGQYLTKNLRYPADARRANVAGRVFVQFVVTETGNIQQLRVLKGIGFGCDEEAVRVVSQMPKWNPGKQNGKPVAVQYNLPIQFLLEKREDNRTGQATPPSSNTFNIVFDNSPNARFALYNDVNPKNYPMDSILKNNATIRIRGAGPLGPLGDEQPLYILNDEEISSEFMKSLNPKTIQSIEVMKVGWATARYGKEGENGVVIITTKKP